jgi:hypothetical protein
VPVQCGCARHPRTPATVLVTRAVRGAPGEDGLVAWVEEYEVGEVGVVAPVELEEDPDVTATDGELHGEQAQGVLVKQEHNAGTILQT